MKFERPSGYATPEVAFNAGVEYGRRWADALQARIDGLMLEFCPEEMTEEMTEEQKANWAEHQQVAKDQTP